jgi:hypothetical protein
MWQKGVNMIKGPKGAKVEVDFKDFVFPINARLLVTGSNSNNKPSSFEIKKRVHEVFSYSLQPTLIWDNEISPMRKPHDQPRPCSIGCRLLRV